MAKMFVGKRRMTVEEFLDSEDRSEGRHEFVEGEVFAMSGVSRRHSRIATNIGARLWTALRGGTCRVHLSDVKLRIDRIVYYPDVMVACGPEPVDERLEVAPSIVVEVLSPSTERTDRREKALVYRSIAALVTYILVSQDERRVDRYFRDSAGEWRRETVEDTGDVVFQSTGLTLTLDEIYEAVTLPSPDQLRLLREEDAVYG